MFCLSFALDKTAPQIIQQYFTCKSVSLACLLFIWRFFEDNPAKYDSIQIKIVTFNFGKLPKIKEKLKPSEIIPQARYRATFLLYKIIKSNLFV